MTVIQGASQHPALRMLDIAADAEKHRAELERLAAASQEAATKLDDVNRRAEELAGAEQLGHWIAKAEEKLKDLGGQIEKAKADADDYERSRREDADKRYRQRESELVAGERSLAERLALVKERERKIDDREQAAQSLRAKSREVATAANEARQRYEKLRANLLTAASEG